jgi:ABC-type sugar transport system ATPase subunit
VFAVADRITFLRLGRTIATLHQENTSLEAIVAMMTGAVTAAA